MSDFFDWRFGATLPDSDQEIAWKIKKFPLLFRAPSSFKRASSNFWALSGLARPCEMT